MILIGSGCQSGTSSAVVYDCSSSVVDCGKKGAKAVYAHGGTIIFSQYCQILGFIQKKRTEWIQKSI